MHVPVRHRHEAGGHAAAGQVNGVGVGAGAPRGGLDRIGKCLRPGPSRPGSRRPPDASPSRASARAPRRANARRPRSCRLRGTSVACVTSTTSATSGDRPKALARAPPPEYPISSCEVATATTPARPWAAATMRSASSTTKAPTRLSIARLATRSPASRTIPASSTAGSPDAHAQARFSSSLDPAPKSIQSFFTFAAFSRSFGSIRWMALRPITPGTSPRAPSTRTRCPTSTCGSQPPIPPK